MPRRKPDIWLLLALAGGILYPPLVYIFMGRVPPGILVLAGMALIGLRLIGLRGHPDFKLWRNAFLLAALLLQLTLFLDPRHAPQAYPVIVSLSVAALFGLSLIYPPSLVERIARLTEPDLPPAGVVYTRRVTIAWTAFLCANAMISASLAIWGDLRQWTLWNGLISYLLMGVIFVGEYMIRQVVRR